MQQVEETSKAKTQIKGLNLQKKYNKQKAFFINNLAHPSLDFCMWDKKQRISSFKINKQYRALIIKKNDVFTVFAVGDFHRQSPKS